MYRTETPNKPVNLIIQWAQPQPIDIVDKMWFQHQGEWTDTERTYYGKLIIVDIVTTNWGK